MRNPRLEKPLSCDIGSKRKASDILEQQGGESGKEHYGYAGMEMGNELVVTSPDPHPLPG